MDLKSYSLQLNYLISFNDFLKIYDDNEDDGINSVSSDVTGGKQYTG